MLKDRKRSYYIYMCKNIDTYEECLDYLDFVDLEIDNITEEKLKNKCFMNKTYRGITWMCYDFIDQEDPNKELYIQYNQHPPIIGIPFYGPSFKISKELGNRPVRGCVPNNKYLYEYIIYEDGIVYKNGEMYKPIKRRKHLKLKYIGIGEDEKEKEFYIRVNELVWDLFAKNKLKDKEGLIHIDKNNENCHILNLKKTSRKAKAQRKIYQTNVRTGKLINIHDTPEEASKSTGIDVLEIKRKCKAKTKNLLNGYRFTLEPKKKPEDPIIKTKGPILLSYMMVQRVTLEEATIIVAEEVLKRIKDKKDKEEYDEDLGKILKDDERLKKIRKSIRNATYNPIEKLKTSYGYYWTPIDPISREYENKRDKINIIDNENEAKPGLLYILNKSKPDYQLHRRVRFIIIGKIILYENGKFKIIGDPKFRPDRGEDSSECTNTEYNNSSSEETSSEEEIRSHNYKDDALIIKNPYKDGNDWKLANLILKHFRNDSIQINTKVCYKDNDVTNCHINNLYIKNNTFPQSIKVAEYAPGFKYPATFESIREAEDETGTSRKKIGKILGKDEKDKNGNTWELDSEDDSSNEKKDNKSLIDSDSD